jgi:hypothetical protein
MALVGLIVAGDQLLLWQQDGFCSPMQLAAVWTTLWGASSDPLWSSHLPGFVAWLLAQPVSAVLSAVGGCLTWLSMDGIGVILTRL